MTAQEPLIELRGVSKAFGNKVILKDADLKIYEGDALVVITLVARASQPS